jgi:DNA excision repair protein ERCC-3
MEVWVPMHPDFFGRYLEDKFTPRQRELLYVANPNKFLWCEMLVHYHEAKGDKIIIFCDNIAALVQYGIKLGKPLIYGGTPEAERRLMLLKFKTDAPIRSNEEWIAEQAKHPRDRRVNCICLSKVQRLHQRLYQRLYQRL